MSCLHVDCKIVGFFFSKSVKKSVRRGVRVLRARSARALHARSVSPQPHSPFSASFETFCLTARAYLNTQKYGLFCSLVCMLSANKILSALNSTFQLGLQQTSLSVSHWKVGHSAPAVYFFMFPFVSAPNPKCFITDSWHVTPISPSTVRKVLNGLGPVSVIKQGFCPILALYTVPLSAPGTLPSRVCHQGIAKTSQNPCLTVKV